MRKGLKFAIVATINDPLLPLIIKNFLDLKIRPEFIICDSNEINSKLVKCVHDRVGNYISLDSIYNIKPSLPFYFVDLHNSKYTCDFIKSKDVDILVNGGVNCILKNFIINATQGIISCHPGLIPDYRGCSNVEWAILNDDPVGNTVYLMSERIDQGPILAQRALTFENETDYQSVRAKVYDDGFRLLAEVMRDVSMGILKTENAKAPGRKGNYYKNMPADLVGEVKAKIKSKKYKFQYTREE